VVGNRDQGADEGMRSTEFRSSQCVLFCFSFITSSVYLPAGRQSRTVSTVKFDLPLRPATLMSASHTHSVSLRYIKQQTFRYISVARRQQRVWANKWYRVTRRCCNHVSNARRDTSTIVQPHTRQHCSSCINRETVSPSHCARFPIFTSAKEGTAGSSMMLIYSSPWVG